MVTLDTIALADCLDWLPTLPDNSVDAVVCDPPYGLEFMGKEWDKLDPGRIGFHRGKGKTTFTEGGSINLPSTPGFGNQSRGNCCFLCGKYAGGNDKINCRCPNPDFHQISRGNEQEAWHYRWACEVFRVLKPGGHLLAMGGTRTYHRLACAIEDAGFEIRDCLNWLYGCLSEDTEIFVEGRWEPYHKALPGHLALCYNVEDEIFCWQPIQHLYIYDYDDTAYRVCSDSTDQIVSRSHRCLVERNGVFIFTVAEQMARERQARVPILEDLSGLLQYLPLPNEGASGSEQNLLCGMRGKDNIVSKGESYHTIRKTQGQNGCLCGVREADLETECVVAEYSRADVLQAVQWDSAISMSYRVQREHERTAAEGQEIRDCESRVEGRGNLLPQTWELQAHQVYPVSGGVPANGTQGRLCDGTPSIRGAGNGAMSIADGGCPSYQSRSARQSIGKPRSLFLESGAQVVRGERFIRSDLARIEPIHYTGKVWCVKVPTGAFIARRTGKVFITGNSGFPKSLDISKAIDKAAGVERTEQVWVDRYHDGITRSKQDKGSASISFGCDANGNLRNLPATDLAREWQGWGTALKPAHELICMARKPLSEKNVAANVERWGTGGINVDATRVSAGGEMRSFSPTVKRRGGILNKTEEMRESWQTSEGRWPPNLLFSHSLGCKRVGEKVAERGGGVPQTRVIKPSPVSFGMTTRSRILYYGTPNGKETVAAWECVADGSCPVRELDRQSGVRKSGARRTGIPPSGPSLANNSPGGYGYKTTQGCEASEGSCSRFFPQFAFEEADFWPFRYCAKAGRSERNAGLNGDRSSHPTVKPLALMRWLCRLLTPPCGTVLDPFAGSGSTCIAALQEGFHFLACEKEAEYHKIAEARIAHHAGLFAKKAETEDSLGT